MARPAEVQTKSLGALEIKDETQGLVEAIVATLNVVDHDRDVILPGAIRDGSTVKLSSYGHDVITSGAPPVGLATISVVGNQAILKGQFFLNTQRGREAFETVKALGAEGEWSIGYRPTKTAPMTKAWKAQGAERLLSEIALVESSPVFVGASPHTGTLGVKSAAQADGDDTAPTPPALDDELKAIVADVYARREAEKKAAADAVADAERKAAEEQAAIEAKAQADADAARRADELDAVQRIHDRFVRNMRKAV